MNEGQGKSLVTRLDDPADRDRVRMVCFRLAEHFPSALFQPKFAENGLRGIYRLLDDQGIPVDRWETSWRRLPDSERGMFSGSWSRMG